MHAQQSNKFYPAAVYVNQKTADGKNCGNQTLVWLKLLKLHLTISSHCYNYESGKKLHLLVFQAKKLSL